MSMELATCKSFSGLRGGGVSRQAENTIECFLTTVLIKGKS